LERLSSIFDRTLDKHYILLPDNRFNFAEKKRLLLDKRLEVIEYEKDAGHSQVDSFIQEISDYFTNNKIVEKKVKKYDAFISYSHSNIEDIRKIRQYLIDNRLAVWFDMELHPSQDIPTTLASAINDSRFMIIVITEEYYKSKWLEKELEIALLKQLEGKIKVLPISIGEIDFNKVPEELRNINFLRLKKDFSFEDLTPLLKILKKE
jgi:hypothetical protein